ncbi:MAG: hypothetical protein BGO30_01170 [Bacteroidetes bacterium 41-46]|nr:MAG: hypothetical protein BGO30_01170 [Bacteroidetes bacterium 41-46]
MSVQKVNEIVVAAYTSSKMIDKAAVLSAQASYEDFLELSKSKKINSPEEMINFCLERTEMTIKKCLKLQEALIAVKRRDRK